MNASHVECLDSDAALSLGQLLGASAEDRLAHVLSCRECRETLRRWQSVREDLSESVPDPGFTEEVIKMNTMAFGDIAHVLVLYESSIPGKRPPTPGVDSFQLIRRDGRWWIASVTNEKPTPEWPIPAELR